MPLDQMLTNRHAMSQTVRAEVSPKSHEWGYRLARAHPQVHFRDREMIKQIESKVVNRLRQVTGAIKQDGANRVSVITSTAEGRRPSNSPKRAPSGRASWGRPCRRLPGFRGFRGTVRVLETQKIIAGQARITLLRRAARSWRNSWLPSDGAEGD